MKRIYIAGKLNGMACDYIKNVHRMIITSEKVRKAGFAIYVPGVDFLQGVILMSCCKLADQRKERTHRCHHLAPDPGGCK